MDSINDIIQRERALAKRLKNYDIHTEEDLIKRMQKYKYYKNRSGKYGDNVEKLQKIIEYLGRDLYKKIVKNNYKK